MGDPDSYDEDPDLYEDGSLESYRSVGEPRLSASGVF